MRCQYINNNGEQCKREAEKDEEFCSQHLKLITGNGEIEADLLIGTDAFSFLHFTLYSSLKDILESGKLSASKSFKYNKLFLTTIFPGDKLEPYEGCKNRLVNLLIAPEFFEACGKRGCYWAPAWYNGVKNQYTYQYNNRLDLIQNLNRIMNLQFAFPETQSFGVEYPSELTVLDDLDLSKYLTGIYIPSDFNEGEDEFDLDEWKRLFPRYNFIDDRNENDVKYYKNFINFKDFKKYSEDGESEENSEESESDDEYPEEGLYAEAPDEN